ncbi:MAG: hypothetical protein ACRCZW_11610 [Lactobacillaceae bacterium]
MIILCLFFILIFYVFKLIVYLLVYLISIIKPINNLAHDFSSQPWDSKVKICLDTLVIGFYTATFIFFINKNFKSAFIIFSSIIAFLFIWQSVIMTKSFYEKNKFDLFWQSILLSAVPISLVLSSIIKSMPDYFTIITASAVSISGIKDLCKNIYNLKFKDEEYTDVVQ